MVFESISGLALFPRFQEPALGPIFPSYLTSPRLIIGFLPFQFKNVFSQRQPLRHMYLRLRTQLFQNPTPLYFIRSIAGRLSKVACFNVFRPFSPISTFSHGWWAGSSCRAFAGLRWKFPAFQMTGSPQTRPKGKTPTPTPPNHPPPPPPTPPPKFPSPVGNNSFL